MQIRVYIAYNQNLNFISHACQIIVNWGLTRRKGSSKYMLLPGVYAEIFLVGGGGGYSLAIVLYLCQMLWGKLYSDFLAFLFKPTSVVLVASIF